MPIYEFSCKKCGHQFEELFLSSSDKRVPECPKCSSQETDKLMSAGSFRPAGIPTGSGGFKPPACAPSGGG